jgi:tape measure domain-containing protein
MAEALEVQIRADASAFTKGMNDAIASLNRLVGESKKANTATQGMSKNMQTVANSMKAFGIGIAAAIGTQVLGSLQQLGAEFIRLAEAPTKFKASLEALTGSSVRANDMLQRTYQIAKRTGSGFDETAAIVQRLTIGLAALGANNAQIAQISENIIKLGTIGGSSMADTAAAALQLAQGLASGRLQGDELRSIMERMPTLVKIIADEMGKSVGEIKKLGSEGKISSDIIAGALLKATQQINEDFAKMPLTVERAMNNIKTSIQQAFDNPAAKASVQGLANAINKIPAAIRAADLAARQFMTGLSSFGKSMSTLFEPVTRTFDKLVQGFQNLATVIGPALAPIKGLLMAAFLGPLVTIISQWDALAAYFTQRVPAMFNSLVGAAQSVMATLVSVFQNAFNALVKIAQSAIDFIIAKLNNMIGMINVLPEALGFGKLVPDIKAAQLATADYTNTIRGWKAASEGSYKAAAQANQEYQTSLRTLARTQAETTAQLEAGSVVAGDLNAKLKELAVNAGGTGGGGGKGGGGGAAGGIKKAGDAAKKAAADMKSAQSQVEEFGQAMQGIAQSLGSGVVDALFSIADGSKSAKEAFSELAKSMLKQIAQMIVQMLILKPLMGMFGGGLGGGLGLMSGGGGLFTRAVQIAPLSIGSTRGHPAIGDYTGFNLQPGVNAMRSSMVSSGQGPSSSQSPLTVNINNASSANVKTRREADGTLTVDIVEEIVADRITRGGNKIDAAMQRAFGARRIGY